MSDLPCTCWQGVHSHTCAADCPQHGHLAALVPATKPHCGECDEARLLTTRFGTIPCPNCNPAAERSA